MVIRTCARIGIGMKETYVHVRIYICRYYNRCVGVWIYIYICTDVLFRDPAWLIGWCLVGWLVVGWWLVGCRLLVVCLLSLGGLLNGRWDEYLSLAWLLMTEARKQYLLLARSGYGKVVWSWSWEVVVLLVGWRLGGRASGAKAFKNN